MTNKEKIYELLYTMDETNVQIALSIAESNDIKINIVEELSDMKKKLEELGQQIASTKHGMEGIGMALKLQIEMCSKEEKDALFKESITSFYFKRTDLDKLWENEEQQYHVIRSFLDKRSVTQVIRKFQEIIKDGYFYIKGNRYRPSPTVMNKLKNIL